MSLFQMFEKKEMPKELTKTCTRCKQSLAIANFIGCSTVCEDCKKEKREALIFKNKLEIEKQIALKKAEHEFTLKQMINSQQAVLPHLVQEGNVMVARVKKISQKKPKNYTRRIDIGLQKLFNGASEFLKEYKICTVGLFVQPLPGYYSSWYKYIKKHPELQIQLKSKSGIHFLAYKNTEKESNEIGPLAP